MFAKIVRYWPTELKLAESLTAVVQVHLPARWLRLDILHGTSDSEMINRLIVE